MGKVLEYFSNLWYSVFIVKGVREMKKSRPTIYSVAKYFLSIVDRESGETITPLKLQKILYYAQGWYMAYYDKPLFAADFEAWEHGPANRDLYVMYKSKGYNVIEAPENKPVFDNEISNFLNRVWNTYGIYDGKYLEQMTHKEIPWKKTVEEKGYNHIIRKELIKEFFKKRLNEQ